MDVKERYLTRKQDQSEVEGTEQRSQIQNRNQNLSLQMRPWKRARIVRVYEISMVMTDYLNRVELNFVVSLSIEVKVNVEGKLV